MALLLQKHSQNAQASGLPSGQKVEIGLLRHYITRCDGEQININTAPTTSLRQDQGVTLMPIAAKKTWIDINDS
jgi:hypothetical protein